MDRAIKFYSTVLGAETTWTSPRWSSLQIAGVRIGLAENPQYDGGRVGLYFAVTDLDAACAVVKDAGGKVVTPAMQAALTVFIAEVADTEGNIFTLRKD